MKKYDIVSIGELLTDFTPHGNSENGNPCFEANPGGAPANFLAAASCYGAKCAMIANVGNDVFGESLIKALKNSGICTNGIIKDKNTFTTLAFVTLDEKGNRNFSFSRKPGADTMLEWNKVNKNIIEETKLIHFGTLSFTNDPSKTTVLKALEFAKEKNIIISFDPNYRESLWKNKSDAKNAAYLGFKYADIVKISEDEVKFYLNTDEKNGADILLQKYKCKIVFVTLGEKGCYYATKTFNGYIQNYNDVVTRDTTGAGDIFGGSAVAAILEKNKELHKLTEEDIKEIVKYSCTAASLSTEKYGGISSVLKKENVLKHI